MKVSFICIIDALFSACIFFVACLFFLNYFLSVDLALFISVLLTLPVCFFAFYKLNAKRQSFLTKKQDRLQMEKCISSLNLMTKNQVTDLFFDALTKQNVSVNRKNNVLFITQKECALFFNFSFDGVSKTFVVKVFNSIPKNYKAYIFSGSFSEDLLRFIYRFDKRLFAVDGVKTYKFLKENDCLPQEIIDFNSKKLDFNSAMGNLFKRKNAKRFLSFGVAMLFLSFLVPIKIYYLIFGCSFLLYSLFCRLFGKEEQKH